MFFGREEEINQINKLLEKDSASCIIFGKRKVGKTTLLKHILSQSDDKFVYFECLKSPLEENVIYFSDQLKKENLIPSYVNFNNFQDIFKYLSSLSIKINIIIDEYPYLKFFTNPLKVDSIFQNIIDNDLKNIRLFISGSHIGMMKDSLEQKNALYGRFDLIINLKELDYLTCSNFYNDKSLYDKVGFYSIFGGSPYINKSIDNKLSLKDNIINTILNQTNYVYNYLENLLLSDYSTTINAERILFCISNGKKKYKEIESKLNMQPNGNLAKQLLSLEKLDLLVKTYPINKQNDNKSVYYEIKDNLLRFYYTYIYKNKSALTILGEEAFYNEYIEPSILTFISHRFEEIVKDYFSLCIKKGKLTGIKNIGTYYYNNSITKTNGEFDVVLQIHDSFDIYEVKYYNSPMTKTQIQKEITQIRQIKGINVGKIGFVSASGYEIIDNEYDCLTLEDLYNI